MTEIGLNEYINIARITATEKLLGNSNYFASVFKNQKGLHRKSILCKIING